MDIADVANVTGGKIRSLHKMRAWKRQWACLALVLSGL